MTYKIVNEEYLKTLILITGEVNRQCHKCKEDKLCYFAFNFNQLYRLCKECYIQKFGVNPHEHKT